jgi:hypothetical protein
MSRIRISRVTDQIRPLIWRAGYLYRWRHVVVMPIVLGRGERLWDGLDTFEKRFRIEAVTSPSGVTHLSFTRQ